jgi:hypothetical protein
MLMKRVWGHIAAGVTLLTGGIIGFSACKHDDSTLFVQDVLAGQPVTAGQQCTFSDDPTQAFISSGVLDIALAQDYNPTYLIGNQSVAEVNSQQLQTETNIITVQGAVVRIVDGTSGAQLSTFTRLAAATVYPSSGSVPGYEPITVTTLDSNTIQHDALLLANVGGGGITRLVTYVTFFGVTTGGDNIQSDEFEFPVDVCSGCLISFSATDDNPHAAQPNCLLAGASGATAAPAPCVTGQDFPIDCSECQEFTACRGAVPAGAVVDAGTD